MSTKRTTEWIDEATGYACMAKLHSHWCGYVAVPAGHPLEGKDYNDRIPRPADLLTRPIGGLAHSPVLLVTAAHMLDKDEATCPIDLAIDVHGGITFADRWAKDGPWFFGFDCGHCDDTPETCDLDYVRGQCALMAKQLKALEVSP